MKIGAIIKEIRQERGLSLNEISRRSSYWSYHSWGRLERGDRKLTVEEVESVAIVLGMDAIELFKRYVSKVDR
jgi:transcriptional regulator with XRE-family HTH domain